MLRPIKNKDQYEDYLEATYKLLEIGVKEGTAESDELELLSILIEEYEKKEYSIEAPNPIEAILFRIDQLGMTRSELKRYLGSRSRVSEILSGKRKLSLSMIRKLNKDLNIPAEVLIQDYESTHVR
jgi:HTH-type transcriptional regulator/antitoxin HigA